MVCTHNSSPRSMRVLQQQRRLATTIYIAEEASPRNAQIAHAMLPLSYGQWELVCIGLGYVSSCHTYKHKTQLSRIKYYPTSLATRITPNRPHFILTTPNTSRCTITNNKGT